MLWKHEEARVNYNPYQAPQAVAAGGAPGLIANHGPQPWAVGETFELAWEGFKRNWLALIAAFIIAAVVAVIPAGIPGGLVGARVLEPGSAVYFSVFGVTQLVSFAIGSFFEAGMVRLFVTVARGQEADLGMLFGGGNKMLFVFLQRLLTYLVCCIAGLLLFVPGVILAIGLCLATFFVVDADLGPVDAMKASWNATKGHKGSLFVFFLAVFGIRFLGLLACCVGTFVAAQISSVALAIIYVRLSGRGTATSAYVQTNYPGAGGGYGGGYGGMPPQGGPGYGPGGGYGGPQGGPGGYGPPQGGGPGPYG